MSASDSASSVEPPFSPPDCPWRKVSPESPIPESAVYKDGKLNGDKVYVGRVYDGKCLLVGTVIPQKGICIYLNKNNEVKSSTTYEILTVDCGDPLDFFDMDLDNDNIFVAGIDETEAILYAGRHIDSQGNTYYGWISKADRSLHIPRDSTLGPQVHDKEYGVLIHKFLHLLCICPPGPF